MGCLNAAPKMSSRRNASRQDLSLIIRFDDLVRGGNKVLNKGRDELELLRLVKQAIQIQKKWKIAEEERTRLVAELVSRDRAISEKESQIKDMLETLEEEQRARLRAEAEKDQLHKNLSAVVELLSDDSSTGFNLDTLERIKKVNRPTSSQGWSPKVQKRPQVSFKPTCDSSDEGIEEPVRRNFLRPKQKKVFCNGGPNVSLVATTTVTVDNNGTAHAESVIESREMPMSIEQLKRERERSRLSRERDKFDDFTIARKDENIMVDYANEKVDTNSKSLIGPGSVSGRPHDLQRKKLISIDTCSACEKRIKFGKNVMKCRVCCAVFHVGCELKRQSKACPGGTVAKSLVSKMNRGYLADFAPEKPPLIPGVLEICIREVEARGMLQVGLYRVEGSQAETIDLLNRLLSNRISSPELSKWDINVITSCVKKFLRNLRDPIVPFVLWNKFVAGFDGKVEPIIKELPRVNLDTLGFIILHLKLVAQHSKINKMTANNLATVMAPTIVGNLGSDPSSYIYEAEIQKRVMLSLMNVSNERWHVLINSPSNT